MYICGIQNLIFKHAAKYRVKEFSNKMDIDINMI